jgi:drug/metabolite transporter (DMT)-like permease
MSAGRSAGRSAGGSASSGVASDAAASPPQDGPAQADRTGTLLVLAAAALFSTGGAAIKLCSFPGWQVSGLRSLLAALVLLVAVPGVRRLPSRRMLLVALAYAASLSSFALANKMTTSANAIFLQSTAPLYLLLLSPWLLRERVRAEDVAYLAILAGGLLLFFRGDELPQPTAPDPVAGNLLACASAVAWAFTVAGLRGLARGQGSEPAGIGDGASVALAATVWGNLLAFGISLFRAPEFVAGTSGDWLAIGFLGVFQVAAAYACLTAGVRRVPALTASLLLLLEPVLSTFWAWVVHGESVGPWALVGAEVILGATILRNLRGARAR